MSSNAGISAFIERIKGMFNKKPEQVEQSQATSDAVRQAGRPATSPSVPGTNLPTDNRATDSQIDMPTFPRPDQGYQVSRGGAAATGGGHRRPSSTFVKLQALSASGTGSAQSGMVPPDQSLNNLLDQMDQKKE